MGHAYKWALGYSTDAPLTELWNLAQQERFSDLFQCSNHTVRHKASGLTIRGSFSCDIHCGHGKLSLYSDQSGPTLEVYVGENWECDKGWWHVNHLLRREPRRSLSYHGAWGADESPPRRYWYNGCVAPFMVHNDDIGRAYSPINGKAPIGWLWAMTTPEYRKLEPMDADAPRYMSLPSVIDYFAQQVQAVVDQILRENS